MRCLNLPLLLGVLSVYVLYAIRLTSLSVLRLHYYPNDNYLTSRDTYPASLNTVANRSLYRADCGAPKRIRTPTLKRTYWIELKRPRQRVPRTIACELGVYHSTIWEVLREKKLNTYHPKRVHAMGPADFALRANKCFLHHSVEYSHFSLF